VSREGWQTGKSARGSDTVERKKPCFIGVDTKGAWETNETFPRPYAKLVREERGMGGRGKGTETPVTGGKTNAAGTNIDKKEQQKYWWKQPNQEKKREKGVGQKGGETETFRNFQ